MPLYAPAIKEIQCLVIPAGSTAELAVYPGPAAPSALSGGPNPVFIATGPGSCYGLIVNTKVLAASNTGTFRIRRSQDFGSTWVDLGGSAVSCTISPGGTSGKDLVHVGTFAAGDWIVPTAQFSLGDFLNGGLRFKFRYQDNN